MDTTAPMAERAAQFRDAYARVKAEINKVTVGGTIHILQEPFFVLATQNPIEQEGTYPLPEAQLDRFFFKLIVNYSGREEMATILERTTRNQWPTPERVMTGEEIRHWQSL